MPNKFIKAFTLVEMLVALAVSSIIIAATYASYEMVATQYKKNMDIADMHTSGRAIMRIIERDIRMAGFEYRDKDAKVTYGTISNPLTIKDSGNKCCDEVTVIYDYFDEESKKAERIRIRYWAGLHTSNKGSRHRLYKQKDILGKNKKILATPVLGNKDVMADYIEDLQLTNTSGANNIYASDYDKIHIYDLTGKFIETFSLPSQTYPYGSMVTGPDGMIYLPISGDYQWDIGILDPEKKQIIGRIKAPVKRVGYFNPWLGFDDSGVLYIKSTSSRPYAYAYDINTKQQIQVIESSNQKLVDMFSHQSDTNKESFRCNLQGNWKIAGCKTTNGKYFSVNLYGRPFYAIKFGTGNLLYAWNDSRGADIHIVSMKTRSLVGTIKVPNNGQHYKAKTYSLVQVDNTKASSLVSINLTLRTKNQYGKDRQFKKKDYHAGNYKLDKTDKYKRDTFSSTVLVRNLAL
jgi:prepilin-type N-terminal cleavage/methylation domain-containing protein